MAGRPPRAGPLRPAATERYCCNLTDVFKVADRIAVLYLGRLVTVGPASDFDTATAVHWMTVGTGPDGQAGKYDKQDAVHQA